VRRGPEFSLATAVGTGAIGLVAGYVGSILNQDRTRRLERATICRALEAEVSILQEKLIEENEFLIEVMNAKKGVADAAERERLAITDRDFLIFSSNTAKIGLFDNETASTIIHTYHLAHLAKMRIEELYEIRKPSQFTEAVPKVREILLLATQQASSRWNKLDDMNWPVLIKVRVWLWACKQKALVKVGLQKPDPKLPRLR